jgi:hypothetical protein
MFSATLLPSLILLQGLRPASGAAKVLLRVSGKIRGQDRDGVAEFDRETLESLGMQSFTTKTPWYDDPVTFEGVPMARLMATVGAFGDQVFARALNDYTTEIPISDFQEYGVLLALKRNGHYMTIRDKGPLFIVYPFDNLPPLKRSTFSSRSAWQVVELIVK